MRKSITNIAILTFTVLMASCSTRPVRHTIAVSIPPQKAILESIVGDSIEVVSLLRADSNPETFEISVADMREVYDADAFFSIGNLPFEESLVEKISSTDPDIEFFSSSRGIDLIYGTHSHGNHSHQVADPHVWSSPANLRIIADNMLEDAIKVAPEHAEYFKANHQRLKARIDSIDAAISEQLKPAERRSFLVWHPSLSYFARDYDLHQIALGQENKELSPIQIRSALDNAATNDVAAFFIQSNFDSRQADNISSTLGIETTEINPLDADWLQQFIIIKDAITESDPDKAL